MHDLWYFYQQKYMEMSRKPARMSLSRSKQPPGNQPQFPPIRTPPKSLDFRPD